MDNDQYSSYLISEVMENLYITTEEAIDYLNDHYAGMYASLEDWAYELLQDTGMMTLDSHLRSYFNYKSYSTDCELGGDIFTVSEGANIHVVWNR